MFNVAIDDLAVKPYILVLLMSKILRSVMIPLLREYDGNICVQNLMNRYEFLSNGQNLIKPYENDHFILWSRVAASSRPYRLGISNLYTFIQIEFIFIKNVHLSKF